jgi:hypothetical protein
MESSIISGTVAIARDKAAAGGQASGGIHLGKLAETAV